MPTPLQVSQRSAEGEEEEVSPSDSESDDEETPLVNLRKTTPHPFVKMLKALWPFGESFKELSVPNKIYEIIKVSQ